jgi:elongation factor G
MKNVKVGDTHNFALVGHSGDGKTSLGEALLHLAGATTSLGSVTEGTSSLNFLPEEKERHTTISSSVFGFDWNDKHLTVVDTPGDSNFQADGRVALHGIDGAVLLVSATGGAKVGTQRMLGHCRALGVPVIAFVNSMDRERADFDAAVESLRDIDANPAVLTLPMGAEADFRGCIDLVHRKAITADGESEIPADMADAVEAAREALTENIAETDDTLLEKYLEEGELQDDDLLRGLLEATRQGKLTPVFCGVATTELGVPALLRGVTELLPSAADATPRIGKADDDSDVEVPAAAEGAFAALVIKTQIDRYAGTLSLLRVVSGTLKADMTITNATTGDKERLGKLLVLRGDQHADVPEAGPGDIIAVAKLKSVHTGNALTCEKGGVHLPEIEIPQGVISYAITAKSKGDEDKVYTSLGKLLEEDPTLHLGREASTGEFLLSGMGELHVRMTVQKLKRMFGVEVELKTPKVPYRETVTRKAEHVEGKLKKQTGGKGMFAVCYLTIEPKARGEGLEFSDEIVGGAIPRGLIPAVEKGVAEACQAGPLAGYPVVDLKVRCIDGKHHAVDSNEMAFKLAASFGFKAAVEKARPTLLEPIMLAEISGPSDHIGDIMGDLSSRRGKVQSTEAKGSATVVQAQVPMAEMLEYASTLTSMTGGQGEFHMEFSHYEEAPAHVREKIIATAEAAKADAP